MNSASPDAPAFQEIFDKSGQPLGALLGPEAWELVRQTVLDHFGPKQVAEKPEPIEGWRELLAFWDFNYPVDLDCNCPICGNMTDDWQQDEPRKFRLTAANLGGLVTFRCMGCQAKVTKLHFKNEIKVKAIAFQDERCPRNLGRPA